MPRKSSSASSRKSSKSSPGKSADKKSAARKPKKAARSSAKSQPASDRRGKPAGGAKRRTTSPAARRDASSTAPSSAREMTPGEMLTRAEKDVFEVLTALNDQMNSALNTFTELASAHGGRGKAVIRTAPLDRATATFQRLIADVIDEHMAEMLPPLVELRHDMARNEDGQSGSPIAELCRRGGQTLDHVLAAAGVKAFEARPGEIYDPLIHLAVGETHREDLGDGAVSEAVQPGYRSSRGKIIAPARVKVNRR